jgi:hypothetical protein
LKCCTTKDDEEEGTPKLDLALPHQNDGFRDFFWIAGMLRRERDTQTGETQLACRGLNLDMDLERPRALGATYDLGFRRVFEEDVAHWTFNGGRFLGTNTSSNETLATHASIPCVPPLRGSGFTKQ